MLRSKALQTYLNFLCLINTLLVQSKIKGIFYIKQFVNFTLSHCSNILKCYLKYDKIIKTVFGYH